MARGKSRAWGVVFAIALTVFIGSLFALGVVIFSYWQGQQVYSKVAETAQVSFDDAKSEDPLEQKIDWAALKAVNPDTIGWIYIPNTNINYPIVQGDNNEYYLYNDFEGNEGGIAKFGCIFMDASNQADFSDAGTFIFGHHLNDGSMFSAISDEDNFVKARTVYIFTPEKSMRLHSFSLVHCAPTEPILQIAFGTKDDLTKYLQDIAARSVVSVNDAPDFASVEQFVALSTCDNQVSDGRYVLFCVPEKVI